MFVRRTLALFVVVCSWALAAPAHAGLSYFLVAERPGNFVHGDSFVVPLSDAAHVAHARDLIARGPDAAGSSILFADISRGSGGGVNRDLLSSDQHEWNWHVSNVNGFADVGIELLDGWPTYVHENREEWIHNTGGAIGFWNYTIVQELPNYDPANPPSIPAVPLPPAAWMGGMVMAGIGAWRWRQMRAAAA